MDGYLYERRLKMLNFQTIISDLKSQRKLREENKQLIQQVNFYKSLSNTYKTKSDFMEDTLRDILHYKLENPTASTKELNERGHKFVDSRRKAESEKVSNQSTSSNNGFQFKPVTIDFASQYLADVPTEDEMIDMGFGIEEGLACKC